MFHSLRIIRYVCPRALYEFKNLYLEPQVLHRGRRNTRRTLETFRGWVEFFRGRKEVEIDPTETKFVVGQIAWVRGALTDVSISAPLS